MGQQEHKTEHMVKNKQSSKLAFNMLVLFKSIESKVIAMLFP